MQANKEKDLPKNSWIIAYVLSIISGQTHHISYELTPTRPLAEHKNHARLNLFCNAYWLGGELHETEYE